MTREEMLDKTVAKHDYDWTCLDSHTLYESSLYRFYESNDSYLVCKWYINTENGNDLVWC